MAFDVDPERIVATNGYVISEVGKPPDFVLEVGSETTGVRDYTIKREIYARMGVREYWRFDPSGGQYHDRPLAGDRLVNGVYHPLPVSDGDDGKAHGYSPILGLVLCWEDGELRFYNPIAGEYLPRQTELQEQRDAAESRAAQAEAQRDAAESPGRPSRGGAGSRRKTRRRGAAGNRTAPGIAAPPAGGVKETSRRTGLILRVVGPNRIKDVGTWNTVKCPAPN